MLQIISISKAMREICGRDTMRKKIDSNDVLGCGRMLQIMLASQ